MASPVGRIVSVSGRRALITVDSAPSCARCAAGRGCGAGLFGGAHKSRLIEVELLPGMTLKPGDRVSLTLAPSRLLHAALLGYGLPLSGVLVAVGIAWTVSHPLGDGLAAGLAIIGLAAGFTLGRRLLNRQNCLKNLVPTVSERNA